MKINFRGKSFELNLRLKSKEVRAIAVTCLVFWVAMTNPGQIDVGELMVQLEALPTAVQSEAAEETPDTGCDVYYSAEDGTLPES